MRKLLLLSVCLLPFIGISQSTLVNPSFEGTPQDAETPVGWFECAAYTTPDILPGYWGVYTEASDGETYIGLITREDGTYESIGQRLSQPLKAKECYEFSLDLAMSKTYAGYGNPLKIRIWGSYDKCGKAQLLAESVLIEHGYWKTYLFSFSAKSQINYIVIEAFHKEGRFSYQGNVLVDNIKSIEVCDRAMRW
ncbi:MAG: hypothetical protein GYB31_17845 [Bacteroidetes bacterium]|nr:hypothetical protein [Bacteroidota bacterium]